MQLVARIGVWSGKQLPYDAEVEWLGRNGTSYLDLNYRPNQDTEMYVRGVMLNGRCPIMGVIDGYTANDQTIEFPQDFACSDIGLGAGDFGYINYRATPSRILQNTDFEYFASKITRWIKEHGVVIAQNDKLFNTTFTCRGSVFLFAVNGRNITSSNIRCYSAYLKDGDSFVRDLIPVRFTNENGETEGAMYDRVSEQLFRNQGTGAFVIGPDKVSAAGGGYDCQYIRSSARPSARFYAHS